MPAQRHRMAVLIVKYINEEITAEEQAELDEMINSSPGKKQLFDKLTNIEHLTTVIGDILQTDTEHHLQMMEEGAAVPEQAVAGNPEKRYLRITMKRLLYAAAVILLSGSLLYYFYIYKDQKRPIVAKNFIILSNGEQLSLDDLSNGQHRLSTATVFKEDSLFTFYDNEPDTGIIRWHASDQKYVIALPDSSQIALSQGTSLQYSAAFSEQQRKVIISGEGDFIVSHLSTTPFETVVASDALDRNPAPFATAIAYGTRFHVRAYLQEKQQLISLLEGALTVFKDKESFPLKPHQQVVFGDTSRPFIQDMPAIAHTSSPPKGSFLFHDVPIQRILADLQKHYGFKLRYTDTVSAKGISMTGSRSQPLSSFLETLRSTGQFSIIEKGDSILVGPNKLFR